MGKGKYNLVTFFTIWGISFFWSHFLLPFELKYDCNNDKLPELVEVYNKQSKLIEKRYDLNNDGVFEVIYKFSKSNPTYQILYDYDSDRKIDEIRTYNKNGELKNIQKILPDIKNSTQ